MHATSLLVVMWIAALGAGLRPRLSADRQAETADRRSPGILETYGRPCGSVGKPTTALHPSFFVHRPLSIDLHPSYSRWLVVLAVTATGGWGTGAEPRAAPPPDPKTPFFDRRQFPLEDAGPGREEPDPQNVSEVRVGYFGPDDPAHAEGGDLWRAAVLAIEDANQQGGYCGKPFRLVARWSDNPWTGGAAHVTRMVYEDGVWAIVGGIDSASTHLAEQVTTKAWLPLVCGASTDRTTNSAIVPWMFLVLPGNQLHAPLLAAELSRRIGSQPFVVIAGEDHESRSFLGALKPGLTTHQLAPRFQFVYRPADASAANVVRRALESQPAAVVLVADAHGSAGLVREFRTAGFRGELFGGPAMGRRRFLDKAGSAGEGVIVPLVVDRHEKWSALEATFQKRFQRRPDFASAGTYDAVQLVVAAIRKAGLNRARIGDALRALSPWDGAAGPVRWDRLGGNTRPAHLATVTQGRLVRLDQAAGR